jgi:hypothetical protein
MPTNFIPYENNLKIMKKLCAIIIFSLLLSMIIGATNHVGEKASYIFGDEIKINDDEDLNITQGGPYIVVYEDNVYITWYDYRNNNSDTYFARSIDAGGNFSSNKKIGELTGSLKIVVGPTGNIYGIAEYYSLYNITFVKSTDGGVTFSNPINVNDEYSSEPQFPEIAVDNNDNIYVVWQDYRNDLPSIVPSNSDIYLAKSTDGGDSFGPGIRVNDDLSLAPQVDPDIAVNKNGEVYIVWADYRNDQPGGEADWDIFFAKSSDGGESFEDNIMVSHDETYSSQSNPKLATDNSSNIYVVWGDQRPGPGDESGNYKIYFSKSTNGGYSFGPDKFIKGGPAGASIVADDNKIYIIYVFGWGNLIYSEDEGETFTEPIFVTPTNDFSPRLALDNQSNIYLVWADYRESGGWYGDIYFKKGIKTELSDENDGEVQNNHQDGIYQWLWILVAVIIIICVAYLVKRKRSKKQE